MIERSASKGRHTMRCVRRRTATLIEVFTLAGSLVFQSASAQSYPDHPVRLIAPFPPGGAVDAIARTVAQPLGQSLGRPVLVENRGGAGGNIGAGLAAKAPADGYTLLLCQSASHAFSPAVYKKLPYDHLRDFAPVSLIGTNTSLLVVHPSMLVKSVS